MVNRSRALSRSFSSAVLALALLARAEVALAEGTADAARAQPPPRVHHAPRLVADEAKPIVIAADVEGADEVAKAVLVYAKAQPGAPLVEVPFLRSSEADKPYVATIPASDVVAPGLGYAIELETTHGERVPAFGSRADLQPITLHEDEPETRERALLARAAGRRTTLSGSAEIVDFGSSPAVVTPPGGPAQQITVRDQYWRLEGQFTYRLFRTVAEFGVRAGMVRGSSPVGGATDRGQFDVGLNYGAPRLRLRAADWLHVEAELLTSVTEIGYSIGGGGAVLLGDPYGTRLALGFEGIEVFGVRGYTRFDVALSRRLLFGTLVEVTTMPHAETAGVRLAGDARIDLGAGFGLGVRGGYQARSFASGGPSAGITGSYAF